MTTGPHKLKGVSASGEEPVKETGPLSRDPSHEGVDRSFAESPWLLPFSEVWRSKMITKGW